MQIAIAVLFWVGIAAFFWWARSAGLAITNNVIVILVVGGFGAMMLFGPDADGTVRLIGLAGVTYASYGIWKTYNMVMEVKSERADNER